MNKSSKQSSKLKVFTIIALIIAVMIIVLTALETIIVYPTEAHRDTAQQMSQLQKEAWSSSQPGTVLNSAKYKELESSPETRYSLVAAIVSLAVLLLVRLGMIGYVYNYIRSKRLARHDVWATAFTMAAAWLISLPVVILIGVQLLGQSVQLLDTLYTVILGATLGTLIDYVIARFFKWRYDRKHSFVVE